ncbi:MAG: hypothetical protein HY824_02355 [Acidobacteria bacterium]|nr:hypothetical protein [Acidobacteriota bacterium]
MKKTIAGETVEITSQRGGGYAVHLIRQAAIADTGHSNDFEMFFLGRIRRLDDDVWHGEGDRAIRGAFAAPTIDAVLEQMVGAFHRLHRPS